jgi:hypothetical protein
MPELPELWPTDEEMKLGFRERVAYKAVYVQKSSGFNHAKWLKRSVLQEHGFSD